MSSDFWEEKQRQFCYPTQARFGDCDPAGIVYYPRYLDFFHQTMEAWIDQRWPERYGRLIRGKKLGIPTARCEADYRRPSLLGDELFIELFVLRVGNRSFDFGYQLWGQKDSRPQGPRVQGKTVCVMMSLDPQSPGFGRALEIPSPYRDILVAGLYQEAEGVG